MSARVADLLKAKAQVSHAAALTSVLLELYPDRALGHLTSISKKFSGGP